MKRTGRHPHNSLSAPRVRALKEPGRYADGGGLYLVVDRSGAKRWILRVVAQGRRRDIGLGGLSYVSLAEARDKALEYRKIARAGGDPLTEKNKQRSKAMTFEEAARAVHAEYLPSWRNEKHGKQWLSTLESYVFRVFGDMRVDQIETVDILRALSPIWLTRQETARRTKQRMATVLDWCHAKGYRSGENPVASAARGLPKQDRTQQHFKALAYADAPDFVARLNTSDVTEAVRLAFEFLILTASRTGEVIGAQWAEIDFEAKTWMIPAERMKARREHIVPLSLRCLAILRQARKLSSRDDYLFPGAGPAKPLSNMAFLMVLRRMGVGVTAHGFRSCFRDWAAEQTNFSHEVCELALAHTIKNKAEKAYRRGPLLQKRRTLMTAWADYLTEPSAEVVRIRA